MVACWRWRRAVSESMKACCVMVAKLLCPANCLLGGYAAAEMPA